MVSSGQDLLLLCCQDWRRRAELRREIGVHANSCAQASEAVTLLPVRIGGSLVALDFFAAGDAALRGIRPSCQCINRRQTPCAALVDKSQPQLERMRTITEK
jgi:hypothetical protein